MKIARYHTTPLSEFEKFATYAPGAVVWEEGNKRILVAHIPNWLARDPVTAPPILAFQAIEGRTYLGTFITLDQAETVLQ